SQGLQEPSPLPSPRGRGRKRHWHALEKIWWPTRKRASMRDVLLEIRDLRTYFFTEDGVVKAINGVNLEIASGETLGLVGESGSGKSVTALSILRLIQDPPGKIVSGQILFKGDDLLTYPTAQLRRDIRGREIAMIFQDPLTSLNPVFTVGSQLAEAI